MIISKFIDSLKLDRQYTDDLLELGIHKMEFHTFMDTFDYDKKWMYIGSGALPPCSKLFLWSILETVYPIEYKYMFYIKKIFVDHYDDLKANTNVRGIRKINGHQVHFIGSKYLRTSFCVIAVSFILSIV